MQMKLRRIRTQSGFSLVEVVVSAFILATLFLSLACAFNSNLIAVDMAKDMTKATTFMENTLQSLSAQTYENLLAMNGNQFWDQPLAADSRYTIQLAVFNASPDLLQIRAVMTDMRTNMELARVVTHRSKR